MTAPRPRGRSRGGPARRPHAKDGRRDARAGPAAETPRLFGLHAVREAWLNSERRCRRLWATEAGSKSLAEAVERARAEGLSRPEPEIVDRARLDRLAGSGAVHQGLVLEADPLEPTDLDDIGRAAEIRGSAAIIVLDRVTDPHNIGAILRSAAAFGALAMIVTDRHAPEITGTLAKSASGAVEHVPMVRVRNLAEALEALKSSGFRAVGLDEEAETTLAEAVAGAARIAIVLGAEGAGLRQRTRETCDALAGLPTRGPIASLNVSNAAAVALYELARGR